MSWEWKVFQMTHPSRWIDESLISEQHLKKRKRKEVTHVSKHDDKSPTLKPTIRFGNNRTTKLGQLSQT